MPAFAAEPLREKAIVLIEQNFGKLPVPKTLGNTLTQHSPEAIAELAKVVKRDKQHKCVAQRRREVEWRYQPLRNGGYVEQMTDYGMLNTTRLARAFPRPVCPVDLSDDSAVLPAGSVFDLRFQIEKAMKFSCRVSTICSGRFKRL